MKGVIATQSNYWISPNALHFTLNALGDPDYIIVTAVSGAVIVAHMSGVEGLGYDAAHNYQRWPLLVGQIYFPTTTKKYVYAAIPRTLASGEYAQLVYPSEQIDLYGYYINADGEVIEVDGVQQKCPTADAFFFIPLGLIGPSVDSGNNPIERVWMSEFNCGMLNTDEAVAGGVGGWADMIQYSQVTNTMKFMKRVTELIIDGSGKLQMLAGSVLDLFGTAIRSVATSKSSADSESDDQLATTGWLNGVFGKRFLRKDVDDVAEGNYIFRGETVLKKVVTVGDFEKDAQAGIGSRTGVQLLPDGKIVGRDLELSGSLSVPAIKYNSIEVLAGTRWDSAGKGRIKEMVSTDDTTHECRFILDLNEGEPGEFMEGDILRGFWHNIDSTKNADANKDDHKGNIERAGFQSLYCRVVSVEDVVARTVKDVTIYVAKDENYEAKDGDVLLAGGLVTAAMRQYHHEDNTISYAPYPEKYAVLSVSGSFSTEHSERQKFFVYTTSYIARFANVNTWEWEDANFKGGWGDLTGFTMIAEGEDGHIYTKEFSGEALASGDLYVYGVIDQFRRFSDSIEIILSRADGVMSSGETVRADFILKDVEGEVVTGGYTLYITRQSGNEVNDKAWNERIGKMYPDGIPSALTFTIDDVPLTGAVFVVVAYRRVGEQEYTTSSAFTLSHPTVAEVYTLQLSVEPSLNADGTLADGEQAQLTARVFSSAGTDVEGFTYSVARRTDDTAEDQAWNDSHTMNGNTILLTVDDLGVDNAAFIVTASLNEGGNLYRQLTAIQVMKRVTKQKLSIDLGRTSETAKADAVYVVLSPRLLSGTTDITDNTLDTDWSWQIETLDANYDKEWNDAHLEQRELVLTNEQLPANWQNQSPLKISSVCDYRGSEVRSVTSFNRAYPRFRRGETYFLDLDITFDGDGYEDSDFLIEVVNPNGNVTLWPFVRSASKFTMEFQGTETESMMLGKYRVTLWYHKGTSDQDCVDFEPAFEIVSSTEMK